MIYSAKFNSGAYAYAVVVGQDKQGKFDSYKTIPSFREYVLVGRNKCWAETRLREEPDLWHERVITFLEGRVFCTFLNLHYAILGSDSF